MQCDVYKTEKTEGLYLFVKPSQKFDELPEELHSLFINPEKFLEIKLDENKELAQVKALDVMASLNEKGYFIQFPPVDVANQTEH